MGNEKTIDKISGDALKLRLQKIERCFNADVVTIFGPIMDLTEKLFEKAISTIETKSTRLVIILNTEGGSAQSAESMVRIMRRFYNEVYFLIPDYAMSAGTIFAMAGDKIYMGFNSSLGPIDPQISKIIDGQERWVPALSYINKYNALIEKSKKNDLSSAEFLLMKEQFNLAELERFQEAIDLTTDLLKKWLSTYKFKDWAKEDGTQHSKAEKEKRAVEVAKILNDQKIWHSRSRRISRDILTDTVKLRIDKLEDVANLEKSLSEYWLTFTDFIRLRNFRLFVHSKNFFL